MITRVKSNFPSLYVAINRGLPNIATYVRVVLKREKLSEEAESYRLKYETLLTQLEQAVGPLRPVSLVGDDDSGYFSANRPKGGQMLRVYHVCVLCMCAYGACGCIPLHCLQGQFKKFWPEIVLHPSEACGLWGKPFYGDVCKES